MAISSLRSDDAPPEPEDRVPTPEPDARPVAITEHPLPGEYGAHAFGRDIGAQLTRRLNAPLTALIYRANPWERRPCPHAQFWDYTIGGHQIRVTHYETRPLHGLAIATFALHLDTQAVPFQRAPVDDLTLQLGYALWSAHFDLAEHTHPISTPTLDTTGAGSVDPS
jgi:hypothetical protein